MEQSLGFTLRKMLMTMSKKSDSEIIEFVRKTTEAITVISESTKQIGETTGAIKEMISTQNTANAAAFKSIEVQVGGLMTMFKYVIVPLVSGILLLVGVKMVFKL